MKPTKTTTTPQVKLCINCKHHGLLGYEHWCQGYTSPVDGLREEAVCRQMRQFNGVCGPSGKLWEPKETKDDKHD